VERTSARWGVLVVGLLAGCRCEPDRSAADAGGAFLASPSPSPAHNVMLVVLDDVGVDQLAAWGAVDVAATPTLDRLASEGVRFHHAWADAVCSPSRMGMLTGQHAVRYGFGSAIAFTSAGLPFEAITLPEVLGAVGHVSAAVGKWHITGEAAGLDGPNRHGFLHFFGALGTLDRPDWVSYHKWPRVEDGVGAVSRGYATTETADAAIRYAHELPEPWFLWVAFHAPHLPFHVPPATLTTHHATPRSSEYDKYRLMIESVDHELGRVLAALAPEVRDRTTVIVIGDNGTPNTLGEDAPDVGGKGTVAEGGIRVPLVISGAGVEARGRVVTAPVSHVDLLPTIAELNGAAVAPSVAAALDGRTLTPYLAAAEPVVEERVVMAEYFQPNAHIGPPERWERAVTNGQYKLVRRLGEGLSLYSVAEGVADGPDLLRDPEKKVELAAVVEQLTAAMGRWPEPPH
jgi:arylsulfatase A-like enzyme